MATTITLSNALGFSFANKGEAMRWVGDGGVLFIWNTVEGSVTHADLYIRDNGKVQVSLTNYLGDRDIIIMEDVSEAYKLACAYVRGSKY